jgi:hypothetical protein
MLDTAVTTTTRRDEDGFGKWAKHVNACHYYQLRRYSMATATVCDRIQIIVYRPRF